MSLFKNSEAKKNTLPRGSTRDHSITGWWFQTFFTLASPWRMIQFDYYFLNGLKPPTILGVGGGTQVNAMLAGQRTGAIFMPPAVAFFFSGETHVSNKNEWNKCVQQKWQKKNPWRFNLERNGWSFGKVTLDPYLSNSYNTYTYICIYIYIYISSINWEKMI